MTKPSSNVKGISFLVLALLIFSLQNIAVKWIGGDYSVLEIVTFRSLIALPCTLLFYRYEGGQGLPTTQRHKLEYVRGFFLFLSYTTHFMGLAALPLADVESIRYSGPLMITFLSVVILGEKVGPRRWLALIVGFMGVLFIAKPGSTTFNMGSIFILISVLFYALNVMLTRKLQTTDSSATMAYYSSLVYLVAAFALAPLAIAFGEIPDAHPSIAFPFRAWTMPTLLDWVIMSGLGLVWAGGMYCMARAYSLAQASVVAPFEYVSLPINVMWGFVFWQEIPTLMTVAGAFLTLFSGVYILYRERRERPVKESGQEAPNQVERKSPMMATTFEIVDRLRERPFRRADIRNFRLREIGQSPAGKILENPHITLYGLDFENKRAVFVETPADVNLSQAPFYPVTQFEKAKRVLTIPFETMIQLAKSVTIDDNRLISIYSVGRCGSTLASQIFAQIPGVINISEPYVLSQLVIARNTKAANEDDLIALLEAAICLLCKTAAEIAWVIKGQSFVIELGDWLHRIYPHTKNLFLYRHAETWLRSGLRAYSRAVEGTDEEHRAREKQRREHLGSLVPAIAQYDASQPLSHAGMLSLMWLTAMERYVQYCNMGIEMLAIRYASWRSAPRKTAEAMLDYCRCRPTDMTAIYETLNRDSQAGTRLSREALEQRKRVITELELEELHWHLQNHAFIHEADFKVPNTLKI